MMVLGLDREYWILFCIYILRNAFWMWCNTKPEVENWWRKLASIFHQFIEYFFRWNSSEDYNSFLNANLLKIGSKDNLCIQTSKYLQKVKTLTNLTNVNNKLIETLMKLKKYMIGKSYLKFTWICYQSYLFCTLIWSTN